MMFSLLLSYEKHNKSAIETTNAPCSGARRCIAYDY